MSREDERLALAMETASRSARRLRSSLADDAVELQQAFDADDDRLTRPLLHVLDSFIQRYQQTLEQLTRRVFPALYRREERLRPPPFAQLLDWLEGVGVVENAQRWFVYGDTRNRLVHEYPLEREERRAVLIAARQQAEELIAALAAVEDYMRRIASGGGRDGY